MRATRNRTPSVGHRDHTGAPGPGDPLDRIDRRILYILQREGRISNVDLAARVGLSASPCLYRVRRLEEAGYIRRYAAILDAEKVGFGVTIFVHVSLSKSTSAAVSAFQAAVDRCPEIMSCHAVSGKEDFLLVVATRDLESYKQLNDDLLLHLPHVRKKITSFSLNVAKQAAGLPLEVLSEFRTALAGWKA